MKANKLFLRAFFVVMLNFFSAALFAADLGKWTASGKMNVPRANHSATLLADGRVLVAGGQIQGGIVINVAEIYDLNTGEWTFTGSMLHKRVGFSMVTLPNGKVLAVGGTSDVNFSETSAEIYDPTTGKWTETGSTTTGRRNTIAFLVNRGMLAGKVLAIGGDLGDWGGHTITKKVEIYDPATGKWSPTSDMVSYRYGGDALLMPDNSILVVGGMDCCGYLMLNEAELFNQNTQSWTATTHKSTLAQGHSVLLPDNRVLTTGGGTRQQPSIVTVADSELFNPKTGVWSKTGSMSTPRDGGHTLTVLGNNQVLAVGGNAGGWGVCTMTSPSAEIYDISTGKWTATASILNNRSGHTATLLNNGKTLIAGGGNCSGTIFDTSELYTTTTLSYDLTSPLSLNLDFATHYDAKNAQTIELKNTSASPITVSNVVISDAGNYWVNLFTDNKLSCRAKHYTANLKNFTIPANKSCTINIGFSPFDDLTAGKAIPATLTLKTMINGMATDKVINLTGIGRAQVANFYNNNTKLWGQNTWGVSELKAGNAPINTSLVGAATGYGSAKFWYGGVINPVLQKATASVGNLVVFAQNSRSANGHVGVVIQTTPVVTMLSMNDTGAGLRKWSVRPVDWYPNATATWQPLITGFNATDATKHYGFISWKNALY